MSEPIVDVAVACSSVQYSTWWVGWAQELLDATRQGVHINALYAISSALPDHNKSHTITQSPFWNVEDKRRFTLTDANRTLGTQRFLDGPADWLWWVDDDTPPPKGALSKLLSAGRDFIGGLYFNPKHPHNPIAYLRRDDGLYHAFYGYARGTLTQVDSIGMGCTLIHRSVFLKIMEAHKVYQRPNASLIAVHKDDIVVDPYDNRKIKETSVINGVLHMPLLPIEESVDENRPFPFYALEYGRTEDHHFCEMADRVGIQPWLDTNVICEHIKPIPIGEKEYRAAQAEVMDDIGEVVRNDDRTDT